jgi:hypothetical protein
MRRFAFRGTNEVMTDDIVPRAVIAVYSTLPVQRVPIR